MSARLRREWPVLSAASQVAGLASGTFGELQGDEERELIDWLSWRISDGWEPSKNEASVDYDRAVHNVATTALAFFHDRKKSRR